MALAGFSSMALEQQSLNLYFSIEPSIKEPGLSVHLDETPWLPN